MAKRPTNPNANWDDYSPTGLDTSILPQTQNFTEWATGYLREKLGGDQNASITDPGRHDERQRYMGELVDWTHDKPEVLQGLLYLYMNSQDNIVTSKIFPIKRTMATGVEQNNIVMDLQLIDPGVRGVPGPLMSYRTRRRAREGAYYIKGFMLDYHIMKTPLGMEMWDRLVRGLASEIWGTMIMMCIEMLSTQASDYTSPEKLHPHGAVPTTVRDAFASIAATFGILGTQTNAMAKLSAAARRILSNSQADFAGFIVQPADVHHMQFAEDANFMHFTSGPGGVRMRSLAGNLVTTGVSGGAEIDIVPMIQASEHTNPTGLTFANIVQLGSKVEFPEYGIYGNAEEYVSHNRTVGFASWTDDGFRDYSFLDFLASTFEFVPEYLGQTEDGDARAGKLNLDLLRHMAKNGVKIMEDSMTEYNPRRINQMLAYNLGRNAIYPVASYGEIGHEHLAPHRLEFPATKLVLEMCKNMTKEDMATLSKGIELAGYLSSRTDGFDIGAFLAGVQTVNATADPSPAARASQGDRPDSLGVRMAEPNEFGFVGYAADYNFAATGGMPYGFGNISGFLTIAHRAMTGRGNTGLNADVQKLIVDFCGLYRRLVADLARCFPAHPCLSPDLVPLINKSDGMPAAVKTMIVAWNTIFSSFFPPVIAKAGDAEAPSVSRKAGSSKESKGLLADLPADLIKSFFGHLSSDKIGKSSIQGMSDLIDKITAIYKGMFNVGKKPVGVESPAAAAAYNSVATDIAPLKMKDSAAEKFAFVKFVHDNAANLQKAFRVLCEIDDVVNSGAGADWTNDAIIETYAEFRAPATKGMSSAAPEAGTMLVQLSFSGLALKGINTMAHAQFMPIYEPSNYATNMRYVLNGNVKPTHGCGSAFDEEDENTFGLTLFTALYMVHPLLPETPRSGNIGPAAARKDLGSLIGVHTNRGSRFRSGYPAAALADPDVINAYARYEEKMYNPDGHFAQSLAAAFPHLPEFVIQTIAYPVTGSPSLHTLTDFETGWIRSHKFDGLKGAMVRFMMTMPVDMQNIRAMYHCNIPIPLGGMYLRPWEAQIMHGIVARARETLGTLYASPIDSITSFQANAQKTTNMAFFHATPMITDPRNFYMMQNVRAGPALGGKGNLPITHGVNLFNPTDDASRERRAAVGDGSALRDTSMIPVLLSYNEACEPFRSADVDICGYWEPVAFAHIMHRSPDFEKRKTPMLSGQYAPIVVLGLTGKREIPVPSGESTDNVIENMSARQLAALRETNTWCHQISQEYRDERGNVVMSGCHHPWGPTKRGQNIVAKEQGFGSIKVAETLGF